MVTVRFEDQELRDSCARFLRFSFPGTINTTAGGLTIQFHSDSLQPEAALAVVERLLWAWRTARNIEKPDGIIIPTTDESRTG